MSTFEDIAKLIDTGYSIPDALRKYKDWNVTGNSTFGGNVSLADNKNLYIGTGSDLQAYHDGTNSVLRNNTGVFYIQNFLTSGIMLFSSKDSGGATKTGMVIGGAIPNVRLYYDDGEVLRTAALTINLPNIPTSSAGLNAGDVWSNAGVLTIV